MQAGILPVLEAAVAIVGWAAEMDCLKLVFHEPDVPAQKDVLALCAESHLVQGPPLL